MSDFYSCERLINTKDRQGRDALVYIVCSRVRGPGKTYSFSKMLISRFFNTGDKFILLSRNKYETGEVADGILKGYLDNELPDYWIREKKRMSGTYGDIYLCHSEPDGEDPETGETIYKKMEDHCGYTIPLASSDNIKKISSKFVDSWCMFFDEFQPEEGGYLPGEFDKFLRIHGSVARGKGKSVRRFPVFLSSNAIDIANPYFVGFGLTRVLQADTKFYRGDKIIFERCEPKAIIKQHEDNGLQSMVYGTDSIDYADNSWLLDRNACLGKPDNTWGPGEYAFNLSDGKQTLGVWYYPEKMLWYIQPGKDSSRRTYNISLDGHLDLPYIRGTLALQQLKDAFLKGRLKMKNTQCHQMIMNLVV